MSVPAPPINISEPSPPFKVSFPAPPSITSFPKPPSIVLTPLFPTKVSLLSDPIISSKLRIVSTPSPVDSCAFNTTLLIVTAEELKLAVILLFAYSKLTVSLFPLVPSKILLLESPSIVSATVEPFIFSTFLIIWVLPPTVTAVSEDVFNLRFTELDNPE